MCRGSQKCVAKHLRPNSPFLQNWYATATMADWMVIIDMIDFCSRLIEFFELTILTQDILQIDLSIDTIISLDY